MSQRSPLDLGQMTATTRGSVCRGGQSRLGGEPHPTNQVSFMDDSGQSMVIMLVLILLFLGVAAFVIDGLRIFVDRRGSQNAADAAALAGALAICDGSDPIGPALDRAASNGYLDGPGHPVRVSNPPSSGPYAGDSTYVEVQIVTETTGSFIRLFYQGSLQSTSTAVARCDFHTSGSHAAIFGGSETCQNTIDWSASNTLILGDVHSNHDIHIGGHVNSIQGKVTYVSSVDAPPGNVAYDPAPPANPFPTPPESYPIAYSLSDFAPGGSAAVAADGYGEYAHSNGRIDISWLRANGWYDPETGRLRPGLYYSSDSIDLNADHLEGSHVTFVSPGRITLSGSLHELSPYVDGLLLFSGMSRSGGSACSTPAIRLSGSQNVWSGVMFAPSGLIQISGASSSTFDGSLIGLTLALNGSSLLLEVNPAYLPPPSPTVSLVQ